jgi:hypothetical protein
LTNPHFSWQDVEMIEVPLVSLCYGRSGDKGDVANIGIIARDAAYYPFLLSTLTEQVVHDYFSHVVRGTTRRYEGIFSFCFFCFRCFLFPLPFCLLPSFVSLSLFAGKSWTPTHSPLLTPPSARRLGT